MNFVIEMRNQLKHRCAKYWIVPNIVSCLQGCTLIFETLTDNISHEIGSKSYTFGTELENKQVVGSLSYLSSIEISEKRVTDFSQKFGVIHVNLCYKLGWM